MYLQDFVNGNLSTEQLQEWMINSNPNLILPSNCMNEWLNSFINLIYIYWMFPMC